MSSGCSGPFGGWHPAQIHDIPVMLLETSPLPYREVWERERPRPLLLGEHHRRRRATLRRAERARRNGDPHEHGAPRDVLRPRLGPRRVPLHGRHRRSHVARACPHGRVHRDPRMRDGPRRLPRLLEVASPRHGPHLPRPRVHPRARQLRPSSRGAPRRRHGLRHVHPRERRHGHLRATRRTEAAHHLAVTPRTPSCFRVSLSARGAPRGRARCTGGRGASRRRSACSGARDRRSCRP